MIKYKVLVNMNGRLYAPYQQYSYVPNKKYICEDFDDNYDNECSNGYYATDIKGLTHFFLDLPGFEIWKCEVGGKSVEIDSFKQRYEWIKLIEKVSIDEVKKWH